MFPNCAQRIALFFKIEFKPFRIKEVQMGTKFVRNGVLFNISMISTILIKIKIKKKKITFFLCF